MIQTYEDAVAYVRNFIPFTLYNTDAYKKTETHDPLDRMRVFLEFLGNPEHGFQSVLIGGTSGKGSTSYLISHMITTAGYKTGLTLSPHLVRVNERIQINGEEVSDEDFIHLVNQVAPAVEKMKHTEYGVPSYFEITVGMAFLYFQQQQVDIAVVEIGMGGTYDATNVLYPLISVLTNVSLDHTQFLGETVEEIARTKVGIIKPVSSCHPEHSEGSHYRDSFAKPQNDNLVVITGVTQPSVIEIVEKRCEEVGARLFRLGKDFQMTDVELGLQGEYQKENASLAIETVQQLRKFGFSVSDEGIKKALSTALFAGRFEVKERKMDNFTMKIILDGAHNQAKMHAFVTSLQKQYPHKKYIFVLSFKKDKNIEAMLSEMLPVASDIIVTKFSIGTDTMIHNASMEIEEIISMINKLGYSGNVHREADSVKAVEKALSLADDTSLVAVTGSLYLVGELKQRYFREER